MLEVAINDGSLQERKIRLAALDASLPFRRKHHLAFREDWELKLGPLSLPPSLSPSIHLDEAELRWAWQRIHEHDYNVNHLFEQQMLESLSALFQRRGSLPRRDFNALNSQLRNKLTGRDLRKLFCVEGAKGEGSKRVWKASMAVGKFRPLIHGWCNLKEVEHSSWGYSVRAV